MIEKGKERKKVSKMSGGLFRAWWAWPSACCLVKFSNSGRFCAGSAMIPLAAVPRGVCREPEHRREAMAEVRAGRT